MNFRICLWVIKILAIVLIPIIVFLLSGENLLQNAELLFDYLLVITALFVGDFREKYSTSTT